MRPCGCDWDIRVFGHAYCWTIRFPWNHYGCHCAACTCDCHKDR
jgi:hypothetical protein